MFQEKAQREEEEDRKTMREALRACVFTCVCISNKVCVYILSDTVCVYFIFQLMNVCMCAYSSVCETKRQKVTLNRSRSEKDRETE